MKHIDVVAGVIHNETKVLCVQRPDHQYGYISRKWEFPGGKIEPGETREQALVREITEELSVDVIVGDLVITVEHVYPDFHLTMHAFHCRLSANSPATDLRLTEHIAGLWLEPTDTAFQDLDWARADVPIVNVLVEQ